MPFDDDMMPVFPDDKIKCKDCEKKLPGLIGYKNLHCEAYPEGKPLSILFKDASCKHYKKERAST